MKTSDVKATTEAIAEVTTSQDSAQVDILSTIVVLAAIVIVFLLGNLWLLIKTVSKKEYTALVETLNRHEGDIGEIQKNLDRLADANENTNSVKKDLVALKRTTDRHDIAIHNLQTSFSNIQLQLRDTNQKIDQTRNVISDKLDRFKDQIIEIVANK